MFYLSLMMEEVQLRLFEFLVSSSTDQHSWKTDISILLKESKLTVLRTIGGPAVGDIRSRCLRLSDESTSEALAVRRLLGHRLPLDAHKAKQDW